MTRVLQSTNQKHNVVFGVGQYAPGTHEGRRLISHELAHVVQQLGPEASVRKNDVSSPSLSALMIQDGRRASSSISRSISRAPDRLIQRDEEGKETKKGGKQTPDKAEAKALEEERKSTLAELSEVESNWKEVRDSAAGFNELAGWLGKGDRVIGLLRTHIELALEAKDKGDSSLAKVMTAFVESDFLMYRFVSWHVSVFANLLRLEPEMRELADSFAADNRAFTGRVQAEESVKLLQQLAATYRKAAPGQLELVKFVPAGVTWTSGRRITLTVTIASHPDKAVTELFRTETDKYIQDQANVELLAAGISQFLDTAFKEGLVQAAEAVVEFYTIRGGKRGGPKAQKPKAKAKKKQQKKTKKQKCSQALIATLNAAMHALCDQPRSCSMQLDTCATATAKVAVGQACVRARTELQQKCFAPGDPGYETHMQQIAEANAALQNCLKVLSAKCK